ncbi:MAG: hypothetical protein CMK59_08645 [Proteobacteria bacterium]|nr:hypothetical protein [Pseudomonadota bacterium]
MNQNYKNIRQKANRLSRQYHLPSHLALSIARGEITLRDGLRKNMIRQRAINLEKNEGLSRSDALQVARGEMTLEHAKLAQRSRDHLSKNEYRSILISAHKNKQPVTLYLHGLRVVEGFIEAIDPYEISFLSLENKQDNAQDQDKLEQIHKLDIKAARNMTSQHIPSSLGSEDKVCTPISAPKDRFRISSKHLFTFHQDNQTVRFTLLEGLSVEGIVSWVGRFEFGLKDCRGAELICFRHALQGYQLPKE